MEETTRMRSIMEADAWLVHTGQPEAENARGDQLVLGFVNP